MGKARLLVIAVAILGAGLLSGPRESDSAFHIMRVWEVIGGAYGNSQIQGVELRMPAAGQNIIQNQQVCFFDASGTAKARLNFNTNAPSGANGASILMGSAEFNTAWAAGSPDYVFGGVNSTITGLNGFTDLNHPVQFPAGKVGFGTYNASCAPLGLIDSVAYGTAYTGGVDYGSKLNMDLPISGTQGVKLTGTFCHPSAGPPCPRSNSVDYSIVDVNTPVGNQPRNNVPQQGPLGAIVRAGEDYYETQAGSLQDFAANPIPLDFFDPGSQPFTGIVPLIGAPIGPPGMLGNADTIIQRTASQTFQPPLPQSGMIPIELVQLSLVSVNPITVDYGGPTEQWTVSVGLSPGTSSGSLNVTVNDGNGGAFDTSLTANPRFTFTRISDSAVRVLDQTPNAFTATGSPFRFICPSGLLITPQSTNFCGSANGGGGVTTTLNATSALQVLLPACGDADADGIDDCVPDNCPNNANPLQENNDGDGQGDACDPDDDNDTILDGSDNCQFVANTGQGNFDLDVLGDACDPDDDNDGLSDLTDSDDDNDKVADVDEGPCGGATPSNLKPERIDGAFAGTDEDGDTMIDEALPGGTANFDCDGDGFRGSTEGHVYGPSMVADQDPCGSGVIPPTVPATPLGWAADLIGGAFSGNRINTQDLATYLGPVRYINTNVGSNSGDVRWDVVPGSTFGAHINVLDLATIVSFMPPMLGLRAFNYAPGCPWAP